MGKTVKKTNKTERKLDEPQVRVDYFAKILQIVAILAVVGVVIADNLITDSNIPVYIPAGLMGIAIGLSPEQFVELIKAFFAGRKK